MGLSQNKQRFICRLYGIIKATLLAIDHGARKSFKNSGYAKHMAPHMKRKTSYHFPSMCVLSHAVPLPKPPFLLFVFRWHFTLPMAKTLFSQPYFFAKTKKAIAALLCTLWLPLIWDLSKLFRLCPFVLFQDTLANANALRRYFDQLIF